jgi:hypothetical protein
MSYAIDQGKDQKIQILGGYKFCIAFENCTDCKGYITEKIWDCYFAGTVPIYWGADNITEYIPKELFIDMRDFKNFEGLYEHLKKFSQKDYEEYIKNLAGFLKSEKAQQWSEERVIKKIIKTIDEK